jgi:hypothetical protein
LNLRLVDDLKGFRIMRITLLPVLVCIFQTASLAVSAEPTPDQVRGTLRRATTFFHKQLAIHGGYVYAVSGDLALREAEGVTSDTTIWVQPPGTPAVGQAFLAAFAATEDPVHLRAAQAAGQALVAGQLHSGGWNYRIEFGQVPRQQFNYRFDLESNALPNPVRKAERRAPLGWDEWKVRKYAGNQTTLDDDTTQSAVRFLVRLDAALRFQDQQIHEAAAFALKSLLGSQYPNGGWSANYDRFPEVSPSSDSYPIVKARYPASWPRAWPKDFSGCYVTNDNLVSDMIETLLAAWRTYGDPQYLAAAKRAGDFLLLAQMPEPQPAWAQQYDRQMQPVWSRAFEPPAISGRESQTIMEALLSLSLAAEDRKYIAPIPTAMAYLRKSQLADGRLARFYELQTNRPLYFTRGSGGGHVMTYSDDRLASNYGFIVENNLDRIEAKYHRMKEHPAGASWQEAGTPATSLTELSAQVRKLVESLDSRGAWIERRRLRHHKVEPESGVIDSQTFITNVGLLRDFLQSTSP